MTNLAQTTNVKEKLAQEFSTKFKGYAFKYDSSELLDVNPYHLNAAQSAKFLFDTSGHLVLGTQITFYAYNGKGAAAFQNISDSPIGKQKPDFEYVHTVTEENLFMPIKLVVPAPISGEVISMTVETYQPSTGQIVEEGYVATIARDNMVTKPISVTIGNGDPELIEEDDVAQEGDNIGKIPVTVALPKNAYVGQEVALKVEDAGVEHYFNVNVLTPENKENASMTFFIDPPRDPKTGKLIETAKLKAFASLSDKFGNPSEFAEAQAVVPEVPKAPSEEVPAQTPDVGNVDNKTDNQTENNTNVETPKKEEIVAVKGADLNLRALDGDLTMYYGLSRWEHSRGGAGDTVAHIRSLCWHCFTPPSILNKSQIGVYLVGLSLDIYR